MPQDFSLACSFYHQSDVWYETGIKMQMLLIMKTVGSSINDITMLSNWWWKSGKSGQYQRICNIVPNGKFSELHWRWSLGCWLSNNSILICHLEETCSSGGALGITGGPGGRGASVAVSSWAGRVSALGANGGGRVVSGTCNGGGSDIFETCNGWDWVAFVTCNEIFAVGGWRFLLMQTAATTTTMTMITTAANMQIINKVGVALEWLTLWCTTTSPAELSTAALLSL